MYCNAGMFSPKSEGVSVGVGACIHQNLHKINHIFII